MSSTTTTHASKAMRRANRAARVDAMRDGRIERPQTFRVKKGAGSYRRKGKYGRAGW